MAASALTPQASSLAGLAPSYAAANAAGNFWSNTGKEFLQILNAGVQITVTITSQDNCNEGVNHPITVTIPATTGNIIIGPFPKSRFNDVNGYCQIAYSGVTGVTVGVFTVSS